MPISSCFVYLDEKQPGNAQLAPGMAIIHHVVLHSLWSRAPIIFYMEVSQRCFQTILFLRTMLGCIERFSEKGHKDVSRTIKKAKMELFVALVSGFQLLTNFTKNSNIGAMRVLNGPLKYYSIFWNFWRWSN